MSLAFNDVRSKIEGKARERVCGSESVTARSCIYSRQDCEIQERKEGRDSERAGDDDDRRGNSGGREGERKKERENQKERESRQMVNS